jgi:CheY-like chemotaxis protein
MSKRILVVEDQPDSRQIIRDMLAGPITKSPKLRMAKRLSRP